MKLFSSLALLFLELSSVAIAYVPEREKFESFKQKRSLAKRQFNSPVIERRADSSSAPGSCNYDAKIAITAPRKNTWAELTEEESSDVLNYLYANKDLNLTISDNSTEWDNMVMLVELLLPNKSIALNYADNNGPEPDRYAHVVLDYRATQEPYIQDFVLGPLPVKQGKTQIVPLNYPFNQGIGKVRNYNSDRYARYLWHTSIAAGMMDITMDLWGLYSNGSDGDTASIYGIDPLWHEDGRVISWQQFWVNQKNFFDVSTLLPLGLYLKTDITGRDPAKWKVLGVMYNDIFYNSIGAFRKAWKQPGFVKNGPNLEDTWTYTDPEGPELKNDNIQPPMSVAPAGSRIGIDPEQRYVEWMDFTFFIGFTRDTGIRLYDIRYKGERIIYELGLMEALAHYAGNDPMQSGTAYLDSYYGFGSNTFQLVPGYDCPTYATYLNTTYYTQDTIRTHPFSVCVFEQDAGFPISRHTGLRYVTTTKNIFMTVRSIPTIGNYDYMFDYNFYLDGSIEVNVRASGYVQTAYFANNGEYGYKIHDNLSGSMHDHVLNFKLDFDILGTKNSVSTAEFVPITQKYSWSGGKTRNTMKLKKSEITTESAIDWAQNSNLAVSIVNKDQKNKYGEYRGYKIRPTTPPVHSTVQKSSNLVKSASWANNHLYITKRKDTEPCSANPFNNIDPPNPVVDFSKFLDGESLSQEDLVVWFNLGMHHVPHTGDLPNTVYTSAHAGMRIEPNNYLLSSPSKQTKHTVRVNFDNGEADVSIFGASLPQCSLDLLGGYKGDLYTTLLG